MADVKHEGPQQYVGRETSQAVRFEGVEKKPDDANLIANIAAIAAQTAVAKQEGDSKKEDEPKKEGEPKKKEGDESSADGAKSGVRKFLGL